MNRTCQVLLMTALAVMIAIPASAQDNEKKKKKKGNRQNGQIASVLKKLEGAGLSEDQLAKVKEIAKEIGPKLQAVSAKRREAVGQDTMKKMNEARKAAQDAGKKGKELQAAAMAVLTDEQKTALKESSAAQAKVLGEFRAKIVEVIGEEKAKELKLTRGGKKGKGKKKKDAAK